MLEDLVHLQPYVFYGAVVCFALAEFVFPGARPTGPVNQRWTTNISLFVIGAGLQRICLPVTSVAVAEASMQNGYGLIPLLQLPGWAAAIVALLLLDLWYYLVHRVFHQVGALWRFHLVHHSDTEADFTTTERHHPVEILLAAAGLFAAIYVIGVPPVALVIYILVTHANTFFAHANLRLPNRVDRGLRAILTTPAVHAIHHSAARQETDSNFGMLLTVWDRLFGTFRVPDPADAATRVIGLEYFRDAASGRLDRVLCQPIASRTARTRPQASEERLSLPGETTP